VAATSVGGAGDLGRERGKKGKIEDDLTCGPRTSVGAGRRVNLSHA
jgi:hypothetical protein